MFSLPSSSTSSTSSCSKPASRHWSRSPHGGPTIYKAHRSHGARYLRLQDQRVTGDPTTKKFYRPNLIFWIVMGCGIACFGFGWDLEPTCTDLEVSCYTQQEVPSQVALRSYVRVALRSQTNFETKIFNFRCFWPLRPKRAVPHPIAIQNMRFGR